MSADASTSGQGESPGMCITPSSAASITVVPNVSRPSSSVAPRAPESSAVISSRSCSHSGSRPRTVGIRAKLYAGGGELTDHSSVLAPQGLSPAGSPPAIERTTFATKITKPSEKIAAPIDDHRFAPSKPIPCA